jgi:hypothetical protein
MRRHLPPRVAMWLLGRILAGKNREVVIGDLAEEHALRIRSASPLTASAWYWGQVYRSVPPIAWSFVRGGLWLPTLGVAMAAFIAAGMVEFAGDLVISRLVDPDTLIQAFFGLAVGLTTMAAAGYFAAWIRAGAATALAVIVMISVSALMVTRSESAPLWYQLAFLIVGPLASLAGGTLFLRRQT